MKCCGQKSGISSLFHFFSMFFFNFHRFEFFEMSFLPFFKRHTTLPPPSHNPPRGPCTPLAGLDVFLRFYFFQIFGFFRFSPNFVQYCFRGFFPLFPRSQNNETPSKMALSYLAQRYYV